jgi:hypothetical protein
VLAALSRASTRQEPGSRSPLEEYKREVAALTANTPKGEFVQSDGVGLGYRVVELWAIVRKAPGPAGADEVEITYLVDDALGVRASSPPGRMRVTTVPPDALVAGSLTPIRNGQATCRVRCPKAGAAVEVTGMALPVGPTVVARIAPGGGPLQAGGFRFEPFPKQPKDPRIKFSGDEVLKGAQYWEARGEMGKAQENV